MTETARARDQTAAEKIEPIEIPGLPGRWYQIEARYDYQNDKVRCPNCGGLGMPWGGWFSCDTACQCVALVEDGRAFMPIKEPTP